MNSKRLNTEKFEFGGQFIALNILLFSLGCILNLLSYGSIDPFILSFGFTLFGLVVLRLLSSDYVIDRTVYLRVFSVNWFVAGVSSIYAVYLDDPHQNYSDASTFFELASGQAVGFTLSELRVMTEGSGAVVLWRSIYDILSFIGFPPGVYIGLLVNVVAVSFTAVLGMHMVVLLYGYDYQRIKRFIFLFSCCGLIWLFAGMHLRDSIIFVNVTCLAYYWTKYLKNLNLSNMLQLVVASVLSLMLLVYLREEFMFVPIAMGFAGIVSIILFQRGGVFDQFIMWFVSILGVLILGVMFLYNYDLFVSKLIGGHQSYLSISYDASSSSSLGVSLIVDQPIIIRLLLGSIYLFVFPIPVWIGFFDNSVYALFKSLNAIFFYFFTPLLFVAVVEVFKNRFLRKPHIIFQFFLAFGFILAIAGTSLETRHFGAFLVPLFVFSLAPDFQVQKTAVLYRAFLWVFLGSVSLVHFAWFLLKS